MSSRKAPVQPMASHGTSKGYVDAQANQRRIGDAFLRHIATSNPEHAARWGDDFMQVPEAEICAQDFWGMFATYIATIAIIAPGNKNSGQHYDNQTAEIILNSVLLQTKERLKSSSSAQKTVAKHAQRAARTRRAARSAPPITTGLKPRLPADGL